MNTRAVGFVFARGGSKGLPRKNLRRLADKPLIGHAIAIGLASPYINRVVVSTEDEEIAEVAQQYGADVPFRRPFELATDTSPEWLSWRHALSELEAREGTRTFGVFVSLPATSPLRAVEDVNACIERLLRSDVDVVITVRPSARNPFYNMVRFNDQGLAQVVITGPDGLHRRQDAPQVFDVTTVAYAAYPDYILRAEGLWHGRVGAVVVPTDRAVDIDEELDLQWAEFLLQKRRCAHVPTSPFTN